MIGQNYSHRAIKKKESIDIEKVIFTIFGPQITQLFTKSASKMYTHDCTTQFKMLSSDTVANVVIAV